jgi:hypothetical protein
MHWQKDLYQYEEIPPPYCWQEVQKLLVEEPIALGARLHAASETPPAPVWNAIERDIRSTAQPTPANIRAFRRPYLSYAATVTGLLLLGSIVIYVANQRSASIDVKDLAAGISLADSQKQQTESDTPPTQSPATEDAIVQLTELPEVGESATTKSDIKTIAPQIISSSNLPDSRTDAGISQSGSNSLRDIKILYTDGNYIQLVKPNGEVTRVSYKLAGMVKTMQGTKAATAEQKKWVSTIDQWKSKLEQSSYAPAASNFFDIAGMLEVMETENR